MSPYGELLDLDGEVLAVGWWIIGYWMMKYWVNFLSRMLPEESAPALGQVEPNIWFCGHSISLLENFSLLCGNGVHANHAFVDHAFN